MNCGIKSNLKVFFLKFIAGANLQLYLMVNTMCVKLRVVGAKSLILLYQDNLKTTAS